MDKRLKTWKSTVYLNFLKFWCCATLSFSGIVVGLSAGYYSSSLSVLLSSLLVSYILIGILGGLLLSYVLILFFSTALCVGFPLRSCWRFIFGPWFRWFLKYKWRKNWFCPKAKIEVESLMIDQKMTASPQDSHIINIPTTPKEISGHL